jgi:hypothetical protein
MSWYHPFSIVNHETGQVSWNSTFPLETQLPLTGVATSSGSMVLQGVNALRLGFPVVQHTHTVQGLSFRIQSQRLARIEDSLIQLWNGSQLVGANRAQRVRDNLQLVGGAADNWGVDLTAWDPAWAVVVDFEPAARTPSANRLIVYEFAISFHYLQ